MSWILLAIAAFVALAIFGSLRTGKSLEVVRWRVPEIVWRTQNPRKYWASIFLAACAFLFFLWAAYSA
jgi:hypothetical protein